MFFTGNFSQISRIHCCASIIRAVEPGHGARLAYHFASFFLRKELWADRVQLLQLTKKKKNTKYLLERRGGTNGALSGHYPAVNTIPKARYCDYCRIVEHVRRKTIYHCAACKLNFSFDRKRNHFQKWHSAACDHFCMYT